jgi:hypothetical protein
MAGKRGLSLICGLPLALFAPEALAWGLQTHLFYAQWALLALPLADAELRAAVRRLPRLVLAGACLPDLALAGKALGTPAFRRAHRWATLARIAAAPRSDEERALAVGYASHLVVDVVAHQHFVPEHEARIARVEHVTHALAEWAMDDYLKDWVLVSPTQAIEYDVELLVDFVAHRFRCEERLAARALRLLARADRALRASPVPRLCRALVRRFDRHLEARFEAYARESTARLAGMEAALAGGYADWDGLDPERSGGDRGADRRAGEHIARVMQAERHA